MCNPGNSFTLYPGILHIVTGGKKLKGGCKTENRDYKIVFFLCYYLSQMPHTNLFIQLNFLSLYSKFLKKHMTKSNSDFSTIQVWIYILLRLLVLLQLQLFFPLKIKFTCKSCLYYSILLSSLVKKIRLNILCRLSPIRAINANGKLLTT